MFTITITKPTGEEAIAELVRVAKFYQETGIMAPAKPAKVTKAAKSSASEPGLALDSGEFVPAEQLTPPAAAEAPIVVEAPAPAPAPAKAADPEDQRTEIRALLTPLMKGDKAAAARALVKSFGEGIGAVPADKLADLLAQAKELAQ